MVAAATLSPSTMRVNSPYRSLMWAGCHWVGRPARSAHSGTPSSAAASTQKVIPPHEPGRSRRTTQPTWTMMMPSGEAQGHRSTFGVRGGGPQPLGHHGHSHYHVADGDGRVVPAGEGGGHAGGEDEHPGDLHEGEEPVGHVVDVVGRCEPGEVHPGPPDGEEDRQVPDHAGTDAAVGHPVVELCRGLGDGHHEAQVEQQLERRRRPVGLVGGPGGHRPEPADGGHPGGSVVRMGRAGSGRWRGWQWGAVTWRGGC